MVNHNLALDAKTLAQLEQIPHCDWRATDQIISKYLSAHTDNGRIYDKAAVSYLEKLGIDIPPARSEYKKENLFNEQFFNYWKDPEIRWDREAFDFAYRNTRNAFACIGRLKPASLDEVCNEIQLTDKVEKSSGAPLFQRKGEALVKDLGRAKAIATGRVAPPPCVAYYRTQVGKTRLVWGYPLSMTLLEGTFMIPLMAALKKCETPFAMGYTSSGLTGRLANLSYSPVQYCLDWSKFDSTVPARVIAAAFDILKGHFDFVDETIWQVVTRYFRTCPILMPDLRIYKGRKRGVPSGSWFTQLVDSVCNMLLTQYIAYLSHEGIQETLVLGDDAVLAMSKMPDVNIWSDNAEKLGMVIHPTKQVVTHGHPHFLGHYWGDCFPTRPVEETIQRLATSERFHHFDSVYEQHEYRIDKAISLAVDNPLAYDLVIGYLAYITHQSKIFIYSTLSKESCKGSVHLRGWSKANITVDPRRVGSFKTTIGQQQFRH
jgi:hypothetical protein